MKNNVSVQPIKKSKRIDLLDVCRGFAVLGIFVVNIVIMNSTYLNQDEFAKQWTSNLDQLSERILQLFFYTKFFPIFSLLFGLGISMQALKLKNQNKNLSLFFIRRMLGLFLIGAIQIVFIWSGDVLNLYALLGLLVTVFISRSNNLLLFLSIFFLLFPFYDPLFSYLFEHLHYNPGSYLENYTGADVHRIISEGSYVEGIKLRLLEYMSNIPILFGFLAPIALSMFLLGMYLGKKKIYRSLETFLRKIARPVIVVTVLTNIYRIVFLFVLPHYHIYSDPALRPLFIKLMVVSDVVTGMFYLWIIGWLWYHTKIKFILKPLRHVGRMALTNYIMQRVIGLILFSSVGFSLYETMSPSKTLLTAIGVFCVQVICSKIWLSHFKFGPLEWLWKSFTYKKLLPIRKKSESTLPNTV